MRRPGLVAFLFLLAGALSAAEIREFDLATRERLGRQLYFQDNLAARAEDLIAEKFPEKKSYPIKGWITELGKNENTVYLIMEQDGGYVLAYSVHFPLVDPPYGKDRRGEPLPDSVALRWKARRTAIAAVRSRLLDEIVYNFEVLEDPTRPGFLVYGLASTSNNSEIVVAGHFRVSVSADGSKAERVDALSRGFLKQSRDIPNGGEAVAVVVSQLTSKVPVETFIYTSALYRVPVFVTTKDSSFWLVEKGEIAKVDKARLRKLREESGAKGGDTKGN